MLGLRTVYTRSCVLVPFNMRIATLFLHIVGISLYIQVQLVVALDVPCTMHGQKALPLTGVVVHLHLPGLPTTGTTPSHSIPSPHGPSSSLSSQNSSGPLLHALQQPPHRRNFPYVQFSFGIPQSALSHGCLHPGSAGDETEQRGRLINNAIPHHHLQLIRSFPSYRFCAHIATIVMSGLTGKLAAKTPQEDLAHAFLCPQVRVSGAHAQICPSDKVTCIHNYTCLLR